MRDAAYFIGGALPVEERRAHEESLLRAYHDELLAQGVAGFSLGAVLGGVPAPVLPAPGDDDRPGDGRRADGSRRRHVHGGLRPRRAAGDRPGRARAASRAERGANAAASTGPRRRGPHEPGPEELWNESWYFDAISDDGALGVYHRIGRLPNTDACLVTTCIVRPRRAGDHAGRFAARRCRRPTTTPRRSTTEAIRASTTASSRSSDSGWRSRARRALTPITRRRCAGEAGRAGRDRVDLTWETDGVPYAWRLATRYEIPCRVTGTVRVGDEEFELVRPGPARPLVGRSRLVGRRLDVERAAPRRRHPHARGRVPTHPDFGVGYVQRDGELTELDQRATRASRSPTTA